MSLQYLATQLIINHHVALLFFFDNTQNIFYCNCKQKNSNGNKLVIQKQTPLLIMILQSREILNEDLSLKVVLKTIFSLHFAITEFTKRINCLHLR